MPSDIFTYEKINGGIKITNLINETIENLEIPEEIDDLPVIEIGFQAFYDCSSLTSVTIGNSVTSIGEFAFSNCISLTDINYNGTISQWQSITFGSNWDVSTGEYTIECTDAYISKYGEITPK